MKNLKPLKLNDEQIDLTLAPIMEIYQDMTQELWLRTIKRLKERGTADLVENPYIWQLEKLNDMHALNRENVEYILEQTGIARQAFEDAILSEGLQVYEDRYQQLAGDLDSRQAPSYEVQARLASLVDQAMGDLTNVINTNLPSSVIGSYRDILTKAVAEVVSGIDTSQRALDRAILAGYRQGFTGFVDKAGRRWRTETWARTVMTTTAYRTYNEASMAPANELGIDTYYYSFKPSAREMCAPIQGQIVTTGKARTENGVRIYALDNYGYGSPGGCRGINCRHIMTPFVVGVNEIPDKTKGWENITPEQARRNAQDQARQRAHELAIRRAKEAVSVAEQLDDEQTQADAKARVRARQAAMRAFLSNKPYLNRDYSREKAYR